MDHDAQEMSRLAAALLATLLASLTASHAAPPAKEGAPRGGRREAERVTVQRDPVEGGDHWRIETSQGAFHVWRPPGYQASRAGVVLFVHGYHVSADRLWPSLVKQFRASRQNALFVVVDAPTDRDQQVKFPDLGALLLRVARHARLKLPSGHIIAVAHSGGYRTLVEWLDYRFLGHAILLDALYANEKEFLYWIAEHPRRDWHRMTIVSQDTLVQAQALKRKLTIPVVHLKRFPPEYEGLTKRERGAALLMIDSQYGHTELVTGGKAIPLLLRLTRLRLTR